MSAFACPACGGTAARPWTAAADPRASGGPVFTIVRCIGCGLGALDPPPDQATLRAAYGGDYAPHSGVETAGPGLGRRRPSGPAGRALVVGAGSGADVARLVGAGWDAWGVEPDPDAVVRAAAAGLRVSAGTAEAGPFPEGVFDCVWFPSVLEHVQDPAAAVREARDRLAADGRILVWTQNPDAWTARRYGADWIHLDPPRHLWHFTRQAMARLAEAAGLRIARLRTRSRPRGWLASAEIRAARAGTPRDLRRSRWRKALVRPLCWAADWYGAGDTWECEMVRRTP